MAELKYPCAWREGLCGSACLSPLTLTSIIYLGNTGSSPDRFNPEEVAPDTHRIGCRVGPQKRVCKMKGDNTVKKMGCEGEVKKWIAWIYVTGGEVWEEHFFIVGQTFTLILWPFLRENCNVQWQCSRKRHTRRTKCLGYKTYKCRVRNNLSVQ